MGRYQVWRANRATDHAIGVHGGNAIPTSTISSLWRTTRPLGSLPSIEAFAHVEILVKNAGIGAAVSATREEPDQFRRVIDVNLNGCSWMAQECGRVMRPDSSIVNISSVLGITTAGLPRAAYSASKDGPIGLTRDL